MNRLGGSSFGGIERRKVVEVPSDSTASPGPESATTDAGLSPVKGATTHSTGQSISKNVNNGGLKEAYVPGLKPHLSTQYL